MRNNTENRYFSSEFLPCEMVDHFKVVSQQAEMTVGCWEIIGSGIMARY